MIRPVRLGDVIGTGTCRHCGQAIEHKFWGNGGNAWQHTESRRSVCAAPTRAAPVEQT